jgi:hypothetical protein
MATTSDDSAMTTTSDDSIMTNLISLGREHGLLNDHDVKDLQSLNITERLIHCFEKKWYVLVRYLFDTVYEKYNKKTNTLLYEACCEAFKYGHRILIQMIFEYYGILQKSLIFKFACFEGNLDFIKYLINIGADYHCDDDLIISEMCRLKRFECVDYLLGKGVNYNKVISRALEWCCKFENCTDSVIYLIEKGANVKYNYNQPIRNAVEFYNFEYVNLLLKHGAVLDIENVILHKLDLDMILFLTENHYTYDTLNNDFVIKKINNS